MTIKQNRLAIRFGASSRNVEEQHRRAAFQRDDLKQHVLDGLRRHKLLRLLNRELNLPRALPVRFKRRRLRRQLYIVNQLRNDVLVPLPGHTTQDRGRLIGVERENVWAGGHDGSNERVRLLRQFGVIVHEW